MQTENFVLNLGKSPSSIAEGYHGPPRLAARGELRFEPWLFPEAPTAINRGTTES